MELKYNYGQTPLDEDEKDGLRIKSISTHRELNELEQLNIEEAELWRRTTPVDIDGALTEQFIKKLHRKMFSRVWSWAGKYRKSHKNLGVPWIEIPERLRYLLDNTQYAIENDRIDKDEIAIRFKYELVKIHCFPNGNGRHARMMADILVESMGGDSFSWNGSNMSDPGGIRKQYIDSIKEADRTNDIGSLLKFARG